MKFLLTILVVVAFSALAFVSVFLTNWVIHRRNLNKYDNYDRELSKQDMDYLSTAEAVLETAAKVKTPKWYKIFLYTAFVPTMFLCWTFLAGGLLVFEVLTAKTRQAQNDMLYHVGGSVNGAMVIGIFAGIFLAGGVLYAVSLFKQNVSNFIALNSDINGFDGERVRRGLLAKLEHKIRNRTLYSTSKFSLEAFLNDVNRGYRDGCFKVFYGCMAAAIVFGILDIRSERLFFSDKIISSGAYFSLGQKQDVSYAAMTHVELDCYFSDGHPKGSYILFQETERFARVPVETESLEFLDWINQKLRSEGSVKFKSREKKDGSNRLTKNCVQKIGEDLGQIDMVRAILEIDG